MLSRPHWISTRSFPDQLNLYSTNIRSLPDRFSSAWLLDRWLDFFDSQKSSCRKPVMSQICSVKFCLFAGCTARLFAFPVCELNNLTNPTLDLSSYRIGPRVDATLLCLLPVLRLHPRWCPLSFKSRPMMSIQLFLGWPSRLSLVAPQLPLKDWSVADLMWMSGQWQKRK